MVHKIFSVMSLITCTTFLANASEPRVKARPPLPVTLKPLPPLPMKSSLEKKQTVPPRSLPAPLKNEYLETEELEMLHDEQWAELEEFERTRKFQTDELDEFHDYDHMADESEDIRTSAMLSLVTNLSAKITPSASTHSTIPFTATIPETVNNRLKQLDNKHGVKPHEKKAAASSSGDRPGGLAVRTSPRSLPAIREVKSRPKRGMNTLKTQFRTEDKVSQPANARKTFSFDQDNDPLRRFKKVFILACALPFRCPLALEQHIWESLWNEFIIDMKSLNEHSDRLIDDEIAFQEDSLVEDFRTFLARKSGGFIQEDEVESETV